MNETPPATALAWTGERLVISCNRPLVFEHLHRYAVACALAEGKRVLDIACGEGYGSNLLAQFGSKVIGVDRDEKTIAHAQAAYQHRNLEFIVGDCMAIPCPNQSVDLVASFETIEHIDNHEAFIAEIKRVLAPGGLLVISSPDKAEYRAVSGGANLFHQAELSHTEFLHLLEQAFKHRVAGRQRLVAGSWIGADPGSVKVATGTYQGDFHRVRMEAGVARGVYSFAVCSDHALPAVSFGLFEDYDLSAQVWHLLDSEETPAQLGARLQQAGQDKAGFEEKAKHVSLLQQELEEKTRQVAHFQREAEERERQVTSTREAFEEKERQVAHFQRDAEAKAQQVISAREAFEEKERHVTLLQKELAEKAQQIAHSQREAEEKSRQTISTREAFEEKARHMAVLQSDLEERSRQATQFREASERLRRELDQLQSEAKIGEEKMARLSHELAEARWEVLTFRGNALGGNYSDGVTLGALDSQNRAELAESDRDCLRRMVDNLQSELEAGRLSLEARTNELRMLQTRVQALLESSVQKMILPFSSPQRKLRRLTRLQTRG